MVSPCDELTFHVSTKLQAILEFKITDAPQELRFPKTPEKDEVDFVITISASLKWSLNPDQPITICTAGTPFWTSEGESDQHSDRFEDLSRYLLLRSDADPSRKLLGDPTGDFCLDGPRPPYRQDWREYGYTFITLPAHSSGHTFTIRRNINAYTLATSWRGTNAPQVGEEYNLTLHQPGAFFRVAWWNWGNIEGELGKKLLTDWPNPKIQDQPDYPPKNAVLSFDAWMDDADDDGNKFIWMEVEWDKTAKKVKFVE
jgi:hypothetical protein